MSCQPTTKKEMFMYGFMGTLGVMAAVAMFYAVTSFLGILLSLVLGFVFGK